jgi:hypothetical protein
MPHRLHLYVTIAVQHGKRSGTEVTSAGGGLDGQHSFIGGTPEATSSQAIHVEADNRNPG